MRSTEWIIEHLPHRHCTSVAFMYDDMASQSGYSLPLLYRDLDVSRRSDWRDEGQILDFAAVSGVGAHVLDLGPGDGWPSLRMAPLVGQVVGVDASARRVQACRENAARLGIGNAQFELVEPDEALPFPAGSFDAVTGASSVEQTPDPAATLRECARVLRPGGRLRLSYEDLDRYRGGQETETTLRAIAEGLALLEVIDRDPDGERAVMARVWLDASAADLAGRWALASPGEVPSDRVTPDTLQQLAPLVREVRVCHLTHPSGGTWAGMLREAGFSAVEGTHDGGTVAGLLYDAVPCRDVVLSHADLRRYLQPIVAVAVQLPSPLAGSPWLTATR